MSGQRVCWGWLPVGHRPARGDGLDALSLARRLLPRLRSIEIPLYGRDAALSVRATSQGAAGGPVGSEGLLGMLSRSLPHILAHIHTLTLTPTLTLTLTHIHTHTRTHTRTLSPTF